MSDYCPPPQTEKAEFPRLPHPGPLPTRIEEVGWVTKLNALSRYAQSYFWKIFRNAWASMMVDHPDKGGNPNLIKAMAGITRVGA